MKSLMIAIALACATVRADTWTPALDAPQTGDHVVLNDKTYVLFSLEDFSAFTNKMNVLMSLARRQWNEQHKTEGGRRSWHGNKIGTTVATNENGVVEMVTRYEDGYRHVERATVKKTVKNPSQSRRDEIRREVRKNDIPRRLREARKGFNFTKEVK